MREKENQRIRDKFRQVFDEFEDNSADAGWNELLKKYPETKNRPLYFWISSAAAVLIAVSGLWIFQSIDNMQTKQEQIVKTTTNPNKTSENGEAIDLNGDIPRSRNLKSTETHSRVLSSKTGTHKTTLHQDKLAIAPNSKNAQNSIKVNVSHQDSIPEQLIASHPVESNNTHSQIPDSTISTRVNLPRSRSEKAFANIEPQLPSDESVIAGRNNDKKGSFSVYAGSFFNYAEGSESNVNLSAGISSDFKISRNLKISTGLNLSKNTMTFNQNEPPNAYGSFNSTNTSFAGSLVALSNYRAELLSLDIPINLKYILNPEKNNNTYFQAGLSSGTYLNEHYIVQYNNFNTMIGTATSQEDEKIKKQFQTFDFMRTLNISFGINTQLNKKQSITIEPFLKYPLGGLGSENLKFGASGINLKLTFNKPTR